ncbi:ethanolamine kinase-like protein [Podospora didyma]|uniref:ethanolamine kinase n=1 Tax=Podospora didyma TaxID=330526 RepID=A0AAE0P0T1_9PEZI|nr:ethanolamine kinase-like protein [Podospora didyma]
MAQTEAVKLDLFFDRGNPRSSALDILYAARPDWKTAAGPVRIKPLFGGVPNTLLKITKEVPGKTKSENDQAALVLRANGDESKELVDREVEAQTHELLAEHNLASPLFARFGNGLLYGYLPGRPCRLDDLCREEVWACVAAKLGEYHVKLTLANNGDRTSRPAELGGPVPNIWSSMQRWINVLPTRTTEEKNLRLKLENELSWSFDTLSERGHPYVSGHCDLLCGNILIAAADDGAASRPITPDRIRIIDYEFAMHCPAAFDIANHFSEWGADSGINNDIDIDSAVSELAAEVDLFRGLPGLWWAIHAFVSVLGSKVDFDWIPYANKRLAEYWAWKTQEYGFQRGEEVPLRLREQMWARE